MRWVVFPSNPSNFSLNDLKYSLKLNADKADNVLIHEQARVIRIYGDGTREDYEIQNIIKTAKDTYYIAGRLLGFWKLDYNGIVRLKEGRQ